MCHRVRQVGSALSSPPLGRALSARGAGGLGKAKRASYKRDGNMESQIPLGPLVRAGECGAAVLPAVDGRVPAFIVLVARAFVEQSFPQRCSENAALLCLIRHVAACPCCRMRFLLTRRVAFPSAQNSASLGLLLMTPFICSLGIPVRVLGTTTGERPHPCPSRCHWAPPE